MEKSPAQEKPLNAKTFVQNYYKDIPIMAEIARCESGYRQYDETGKVLRGRIDGSDTGIMQINKRYHLAESERLGYDINTIEGNVSYARHLYEQQGTKPWLASATCWNK